MTLKTLFSFLQLRVKEMNAQDENRKLQRHLRETKEDFANLQQKEMEVRFE